MFEKIGLSVKELVPKGSKYLLSTCYVPGTVIELHKCALVFAPPQAQHLGNIQ